MSQGLNAAVDELEAKLKAQMQAVADTKKLINTLLQHMGQEARYVDVSVESGGAIRADEFYGKPLATAIRMYLERRGKQALYAEDILKGLVQGGFDFRVLNWNEKTRLRNLAISMAKNNNTFHKLPNGTFGLTEWYDAATLSAAKREKTAEDKAEDAKGE